MSEIPRYRTDAFNIFAENNEEDVDGDGLNDKWEKLATEVLRPVIEHDQGEELLRRPEDKIALFTRTTPLVIDNQDYIIFLNAITYSNDYGHPLTGIDSHSGDVQVFHSVWRVLDNNTIELDRIYTEGHRDSSAPIPGIQIPSGGFVRIATLAKDVERTEDGILRIQSEEDKHGTWPSVEASNIYGPYDTGWDAPGNEGFIRPDAYNVGEPDSPFFISNKTDPNKVDETIEFPGEYVWSDSLERGGDGRFMAILPPLINGVEYIGSKLENEKINEIIRPAITNTYEGYLWSNYTYAEKITFADIDGDGRDEVLIAKGGNVAKGDSKYLILDDEISGYRTLYEGGANWKADQYVTGLSTGDVDGDGIEEIGVTINKGGDFSFLLIDDFLSDFRILYQGGQDLTGALDIAFGNIDNDELDEFIVITVSERGSNYSIKDDLWSRFKTIYNGGNEGNKAYYVAFGNVDEDERDEIGIALKASSGDVEYFIKDDLSGELKTLHEGGDDWGRKRNPSGIGFGDIDGDGRDELGIIRNSSPGEFKYYLIDDLLGGFETLRSGGNDWVSGTNPNSISFGNLDGDERDEIGLTRYAPSGELEFYAYDDLLGDLEILHEGGDDWGRKRNSTSSGFGDTDGDGRDEFGITRRSPDHSRSQIIDSISLFNSIKGGRLDDTYYIDNTDTRVRELRDGGYDFILSSVNYTLDQNIERLTILGLAESARGNDLDNNIHGNAQNNTIYGYSGDDHIYALDGDDIIDAGLGDDLLKGGEGADIMYGRLGNDTYHVDNVNDMTIEYQGMGIDWVVSSINWALSENLERLLLTDDAILGLGNSLNNRVYGNSEDNILFGKDGDDILFGRDGDDWIEPGNGFNHLFGGSGADTFLFSDIDNRADKIHDFSQSEGDRIQILSTGGFSSDLDSGPLDEENFILGSTARSQAHRFIYDQSTGTMLFDKDGSGSQLAEHFVSVTPGTVITNEAIFV